MGKYLNCLFLGLQKTVEYRADFFIGYFSVVFPVIIQVSVWSAIYKASGMGEVYGYTYHQMVLYVFFVGVVNRFLGTGFEYEINKDIKEGGLNKFLIKPINYCGYRLACFLGEKVTYSIIFFVLLFVTCFIFTIFGYFVISVIKILLFLISLCLALLLNFATFFCIGLLGLWISEISRVYSAITIIISVISGGIFPLDILGSTVNKILYFLPFRYMLQVPVDIITGRNLPYSVFIILLVQLFWVVCFFAIAGILWKKGLKKYIAVGG